MRPAVNQLGVLGLGGSAVVRFGGCVAAVIGRGRASDQRRVTPGFSVMMIAMLC
jgi:hypothetical protein